MNISLRAKVGFLTTFNQRCGLASYASLLIEQFKQDKVVILAEDIPERSRTAVDPNNAFRCWTRSTTEDFKKLHAVVREQQIEVLHVNCQHMFFHVDALLRFLDSFKKSGGKVVFHTHSIGGVFLHLHRILSFCDATVVHLEENILELLANQYEEEKIHLIPHGVYDPGTRSKSEARVRLGIPKDQQVLLTPGFIRKHKGHLEILEVIPSLLKRSKDLHYYIVGQEKLSDESERVSVSMLQETAKALGIENHVHIISDFIPQDALVDFYLAADCVALNHSTIGFEASGTVSMALGCKTNVVTSPAPQFAHYGNAILRYQNSSGSHFCLETAITQALTNRQVIETLQRNAGEFAHANSWTETARKFAEIYDAIQTPSLAVVKAESLQTPTVDTKNDRIRELAAQMLR